MLGGVREAVITKSHAAFRNAALWTSRYKIAHLLAQGGDARAGTGEIRKIFCVGALRKEGESTLYMVDPLPCVKATAERTRRRLYLY